MQSRLTNVRYRIFLYVINNRFLQWVRASSSMFRTADPAIHSESKDAEEAAKACEQKEKKPNKGKEPFSSKIPPFASSSKLESNEATPPIEPTTQQKRRRSHHASGSSVAIEDVSCVGFDGTPLPWANEKRQRQVEEEIDDDMAYYRDHRPSPLSELEIVDTRKPITRATDGTAGDYEVGGVIGWKKEQLDTAEEALRRAINIWRENAMRGDPDSPQSRVLRARRGE